MDPFVDQLHRLCKAHPTRAKWVFVPAHAMGWTLGDRLALEGGGWANLRFVTPFDVALRMGAPFLVERGIDPSEEGLGPALIMRLLLGLPKSHNYFRPLAHHPELARALWSTITELRMAGIGSDALKKDAFESADKHAELKALLAAYELFLEDRKRGDRATVFHEAMKHPDWCPIQPSDCWIEWPDALWSPLEGRLIDAMPGERLTPDTFTLADVKRPRRLNRPANLGTSEPQNLQAAPRHPGTPEPQNLQAAPRHPGTPAPRNQQLSYFHAGGLEAEIEEVFRRILAAGATLDDVEICAASPDYVTVIWEKALRYDWPVTLADGLPVALTRPGRALVAFADWIEDDFAAGRLRKLLQSGDVAFAKNASLSPARAARLLVKSEAAWGRETYARALAALAANDRTRAERDDLPKEERERLEQNAAHADELAAWIGKLIAAVPLPGAENLINLQAIVACALDFVQNTAARASALDHAAADALASALRDLEAIGGFPCSLIEALRFIAERVASVHVGADRPRPGCLHVSSFRRAALAARRHLFIVGLEEGRVFPSAYEDPILLDAERKGLDDALALAGDKIDEAVHAALSRLAAASARENAQICLSYSCRDLRQFRPTYASWLMLKIWREATGKLTASYGDMRDALGPPKSCVPEEAKDALGISRWWLRGLTRGDAAKGRTAVLAAYPPLAQGLRALEARASTAFTEFDGYVPAAGAVLDPALTHRVVSATDLEKAANCPFKYFLERGLNVRAIESGDRDRDLWLDPLLRGSMMHDAYATLMRRARAAKRKVTVADDGDWVIAHAKAMLADLTQRMPPPSEEVGDREAELFLDDLRLFVEAEANAEAGREPIGFEVAFGRGASPEDEETLTRVEPVTIDIGGGLSIRLAGRIDRIDRLSAKEAGSSDPTFQIIDYKTGTFYKPGWEGVFAGGTRLQHALYGLAALELLKKDHKRPRMAGGSYYFSSAKGRQNRLPIAAPTRARTNEVLTDIREVVAKGLFVHAKEGESCRFCDYGYACGGERSVKQAEAKFVDSALAPVLRLGEHE